MRTIKTYRKVGAFYIACEEDFSTSLTKPVSSRVFNSFLFLSHTLLHLRSPAVFSDGRSAAILEFLSVSNLQARFVSLLSSRSYPPDISPITIATMMISSNSLTVPGRRVAYSPYPVTALQDHCRDQASPHGHYRFPAALFRDGRTLGNQSGHAS